MYKRKRGSCKKRKKGEEGGREAANCLPLTQPTIFFFYGPGGWEGEKVTRGGGGKKGGETARSEKEPSHKNFPAVFKNTSSGQKGNNGIHERRKGEKEGKEGSLFVRP